ncbi:MAG: class I SAM-dependent methyltransferase [Candidatus Aminicenantales bacterium]
MKKKIEIGLIVALVVAIAGFAVLSKPAPAPAGIQPAHKAADAAAAPEITLRNVTDRTITYKIYPVRRPESLQTKEIAPNAIDRYKTNETMAIEFNTGAKEVIYSLDPGKPYSFRSDLGSAIDLYLGAHGRADAADLAPYVPSPSAVVDKMLELAQVTRQDVLYDIGCGDGRIVIAAARKYGAAGVGIDIDKGMVETSRKNAKVAGVERFVKFICMDATKADVSAATVVTLYLLPESNALLRPIFEKQLRPGTRVVSHNYAIPGWEQKETQSVTLKDQYGTDHTIYAYVR